MSLIFTADLHQTDLPRDEYRWGLFEWLAEQARKYKVKRVILGGDLTDAKDKHSALLTNRMVEGIQKIAEQASVIICRGNHDYVDEANPFFEFVQKLSCVDFITEPTELQPNELGKILILPNTRDYEKAWADLNFKKYDYIFCHQAFDGCMSENGTKLAGIPPSVFAGTKAKVWSGDIHTRQKVGKNIEYVGAPYRIRFGDDFEPRVLLIKDDGAMKDLFYPCMKKHLIEVAGDDPVKLFKRELKRLEVNPEDQVKLRVKLAREDYPTWPAIKKELGDVASNFYIVLTGPELGAMQRAKVDLKDERQTSSRGATPEKALQRYAKREAIPEGLLEAGKGFLHGTR